MDCELKSGESSGHGQEEPLSPSILKDFRSAFEIDDVEQFFLSKGEDPHNLIEVEEFEQDELNWSDFAESRQEECEVKDIEKKLKEPADESDVDKVVRDLRKEFRTETSKIGTSNEFVLEFENVAQPESPGSDPSQPTLTRLASSLLNAPAPDDHEADDHIQIPGSKPDHNQIGISNEFVPERVPEPESKESDRPQPKSAGLPSSLLKAQAPDDHEGDEKIRTPTASKRLNPESEPTSTADTPHHASSDRCSSSSADREPTFSFIEVPEGKGMIVRSSLSELSHTSGPIPIETLRAIAAHYATLSPKKPPSKRKEKMEKRREAKMKQDEALFVNEPSINQPPVKESEPTCDYPPVKEPEPSIS